MRTKLSGHQEDARYPPGPLAAMVLTYLMRLFQFMEGNATKVLTPGALVGGGHCEVQHSHSLTPPMTVLSWHLRGVAERADCWWQQNSQGVTHRSFPQDFERKHGQGCFLLASLQWVQLTESKDSETGEERLFL